MFLMTLIALIHFSVGTAYAIPDSLPPGIIKTADSIRNERSREKRLELLAGLMEDVKKRVNSVPENISEAEVPHVQVLYELNILIGGLKPNLINPATCPSLLRAMEQMTNPLSVSENEISPTGRLAIDVLKSVCAQ